MVQLHSDVPFIQEVIRRWRWWWWRWWYLQQGLQPVGLPVPQVEEAVSRVVGVQGGVGTLGHLAGCLAGQEQSTRNKPGSSSKTNPTHLRESGKS